MYLNFWVKQVQRNEVKVAWHTITISDTNAATSTVSIVKYISDFKIRNNENKEKSFK